MTEILVLGAVPLWLPVCDAASCEEILVTIQASAVRCKCSGCMDSAVLLAPAFTHFCTEGHMFLLSLSSFTVSLLSSSVCGLSQSELSESLEKTISNYVSEPRAKFQQAFYCNHIRFQRARCNTLWSAGERSIKIERWRAFRKIFSCNTCLFSHLLFIVNLSFWIHFSVNLAETGQELSRHCI